nr:hypothetical protein [Lentzea pudingi]
MRAQLPATSTRSCPTATVAWSSTAVASVLPAEVRSPSLKRSPASTSARAASRSASVAELGSRTPSSAQRHDSRPSWRRRLSALHFHTEATRE